jgi:phage gp16-like protein
MTNRANQIKIIQIAKRDLGMDDTTYRALLQRVTGKTSSKDLSDKQGEEVINEFTRLGFVKKSKPANKRPSVGVDRMPRMRKIEALLAEANRPWSYLNPILKNLGRDKIEFCDVDDLSKIIAALMADAKRHGRV